MNRPFEILILVLLCSNLLSQKDRTEFNSKTDSLMMGYEHFKGSEFEEYLHLKEVIKNTVDIKMDTALHYYSILDSIARESSDSTIIMETKYLGGVIYVIDYKPKKAKSLLLDYIDYCTGRNDVENLRKSHRFISATYTLLAEYDKAIYHALRAQEYISLDKYAIQFNNRSRIARSYVLMGEYKKAIESWHWYLDNITSANEHYIARTHGNISEIYLDMDEIDSAIVYTDKFAPVVKRLKMKTFIQKANINKARIQLSKGNILEAGQLAKEPFLLYKNHPESYFAYLRTHKIMAEVAIYNKDISKAKSILKDGLDIARKENQTKKEIYFTKALLNLEVSLNKGSEGAALMDSLISLNEKLSEETKKQAIYKVHRQYDVEKKDLEINLLKTSNELEISKNEKAQRNIWIAVGGLVSLVLISFLLYRSLTVKRKSEQLLKEKNNIISSALSEKELLLKEIHHRVKNNLQVVSSLLSLQSEFIKDESALSAINEGRNRVRSMALIHQNLYSEGNLTGINVKSYLEKLIMGLFDTYNINEDLIKLALDISDIDLDVDVVVPLGLIANELVSNALKHAFTERGEGKIHISIFEKDELLIFTVKDNGKGIELTTPIEEMDSFGFQLIYTFKEKLEADIDIVSHEGTSISLRIKNY